MSVIFFLVCIGLSVYVRVINAPPPQTTQTINRQQPKNIPVEWQ
ncbi:hypothetical protein COO91_09453 (plasmid) [Nostoc flagelliforme CCNUN1]|uniref:Uncharacterized protein n=1 Tax=Nostoc flagelliforme CCNUN1 TaxID=2038116 RepID=A0A2K8T6M1_9NOSO|nr:hypothetical protein COO91_09453 [Nostoc flagelliforme CCNUN1]